MATKRRRLSRGRFRRRYRRGGGFKRLRRTIKRVIRSYTEVKYATVGFVGTQSTQTAYITNLNPTILNGSGKSQRIGNRIKYKMLTVKFTIFVSLGIGGSLLANQALVVRVIILQSRQFFSTLPVASDIFDQSAGTTAYMSTVGGTAWRVMYDKMRVLTPTQATALIPQNSNDSQEFAANLHFKLGNNVTFSPASQPVPNEPKDLYYLVCVTQNLNNVTNLGQVNANIFVRLSYIDI